MVPLLPHPVGRRRFVQLLSASAALAALPAALAEGTASAAGRPGTATGHDLTGGAAPDPVAETYYRVLLDHTQWSESRWDAAKGSLGTGDDPLSSPWTPNGLKGGWEGDTKVDEMGVYAQSLVPALVWAQDDPRYDDWLAAYRAWSRNETGLPAADRANPATVDGSAVSDDAGRNPGRPR